MVLVVLLAAFGETQAPYNQKQLGDVWRISYGIGLIPIIIMLVWRVFFLRVSRQLPGALSLAACCLNAVVKHS